MGAQFLVFEKFTFAQEIKTLRLRVTHLTSGASRRWTSCEADLVFTYILLARNVETRSLRPSIS